MIAIPEEPAPPRLGAIVLDIGNTSMKIGLWRSGSLSQISSAGHDLPQLERAIRGLRESESALAPAIVVASVVPRLTDEVSSLMERMGEKSIVVGRDIPMPLALDVDEPAGVGIDRICQAAAARDRTGHACIIVSLGTAITVDLVSDDGFFMGGAILPGLTMQATALHEHTAQLPLVKLQRPDFLVGRTTTQAIQQGIMHGSIGAIRGLVERMATALGTWPQVVATGGDLASLAEDLDFVDSLVPDLCLMGIGLAWGRAIEDHDPSDNE